MNSPPGQPSPQPDQPTWRSTRQKLAGAAAATGAVVLICVLFGLTDPLNGLLVGPLAAFFFVVLGSVLTVFARTRRFAIGFLIASAILIFVTAGICTAVLSSDSSLLRP